MLTEIYIEALLVDEVLADDIWEAWDKGEIDDSTVALIWWRICFAASGPNRLLHYDLRQAIGTAINARPTNYS